MYILECFDDSYYTGSTNNLELRLKQHEAGEGANHKKKHLPIKLVYYEEFDRIDSAFYREKQVQGWSRKKKEALIAGFQEKLNELAECKNESHSKNKALDIINKVASAPLSHRDVILIQKSFITENENDKNTVSASEQNPLTVAERSPLAVAERSPLTVAERSRSHIVITNPTALKNEASLINQLFDEGLSVLHLRKPEYSSQELVLLLQEINPIHYSKIALHSCHFLAKSFGINRLHFNEVSRKQLLGDALETYKAEGVILSTSIHSTDDYIQLSDKFDYAFLSPVFDSISKPNYQAQAFDLSMINKKPETKLIALGGIDETTCSKAFDRGFDGVALLGAIWNSEDKIIAFKNIQSQCPITAL